MLEACFQNIFKSVLLNVKFFHKVFSRQRIFTLASEWGPRIGFVWYGLSSCSQTLLQCSLSTNMLTAALKSRENIVLHPGHWMTLNEHEGASRARRACRSASITLNEREAHVFSSPMPFPCNNNCFLSFIHWHNCHKTGK